MSTKQDSPLRSLDTPVRLVLEQKGTPTTQTARKFDCNVSHGPCVEIIQVKVTGEQGHGLFGIGDH